MAWELKEAMDYYRWQGAPADQNALIGLLREVQRERGGTIPEGDLSGIAEYYGIRQTLLEALIRRIPGLRSSRRHLLELCGGSGCGKAAELAAEAEKLCREKNIELRFVPCMRLCGKGPSLRWDGRLYHRADAALLRQLSDQD